MFHAFQLHHSVVTIPKSVVFKATTFLSAQIYDCYLCPLEEVLLLEFHKTCFLHFFLCFADRASQYNLSNCPN